MIDLIPLCSWAGLAPFWLQGWLHGPGLPDEWVPSLGHRGPALWDSAWPGPTDPYTGWPLPTGSLARPAQPNMLANHGFKHPPTPWPKEGPLHSVGSQIFIGTELLALYVNMELGSERGL